MSELATGLAPSQLVLWVTPFALLLQQMLPSDWSRAAQTVLALGLPAFVVEATEAGPRALVFALLAVAVSTSLQWLVFPDTVSRLYVGLVTFPAGILVAWSLLQWSSAWCDVSRAERDRNAPDVTLRLQT